MRKLGKWVSLMILALAVSGCETAAHNVREDSGNIAALEALKQPAGGGFKVEVEANAGGVYHAGDPIRFKIKSSQAGKLWIIAVNSENQAQLLFPQGEGNENTLNAGQEYQFPPRDSAQNLYADKPLGKTSLAFIVTGAEAVLDDIVSLRDGQLHNVSFGSDTQWGINKLAINVVQ